MTHLFSQFPKSNERKKKHFDLLKNRDTMDFFPEIYGYNNYYSTPRQQQWRKYQAHQQALREEQARREKKATMQRRQVQAYEDHERARHQGFQQYAFGMDERNDEYLYYPRNHPLRNSRLGHPSRPLDHAGDGYVIVRGSDGRLYRVLKDDLKERYPNDTDRSTSQTNDHFKQATDSADEETEDDAARSEEKGDVPVRVEHVKTQDGKDKVKNKIREEKKKTKKNKSVPPKSSNRKKITVIVEDASDSEYDDDEKRSVWRNRRPCLLAGESWMEPVAAYL
jgi:hypothetical protein